MTCEQWAAVIGEHRRSINSVYFSPSSALRVWFRSVSLNSLCTRVSPLCVSFYQIVCLSACLSVCLVRRESAAANTCTDSPRERAAARTVRPRRAGRPHSEMGSAASIRAAPLGRFHVLPEAVLEHLMCLLDGASLCALCRCCRGLRSTDTSAVWEELLRRELGIWPAGRALTPGGGSARDVYARLHGRDAQVFEAELLSRRVKQAPAVAAEPWPYPNPNPIALALALALALTLALTPNAKQAPAVAAEPWLWTLGVRLELRNPYPCATWFLFGARPASGASLFSAADAELAGGSGAPLGP